MPLETRHHILCGRTGAHTSGAELEAPNGKGCVPLSGGSREQPETQPTAPVSTESGTGISGLLVKRSSYLFV